MKILKNRIKLIAVLLIQLVIFQSCMAYKPKLVSLEEGYLSRSKSKVLTNTSREIKFKKIIKEEDQFFGIAKKKGEIKKILIDPKKIKGVKVKDKALSTVLTIALPVAIITGAGLIFQDSFKWKSAR